MAKSTQRRRKKISATLPAHVVEMVEEYRKDAGLATFSAALEQLLWREVMEEKTKAYYLTLSQEERAEQRRWADLAAGQAAQVLPES